LAMGRKAAEFDAKSRCARRSGGMVSRMLKRKGLLPYIFEAEWVISRR